MIIVAYDDGVEVASVELAMLDIVTSSGGFSGYTSVSFDSSWASIDQVRFFAPSVPDNLTVIDDVSLIVRRAATEDAANRLRLLANDPTRCERRSGFFGLPGHSARRAPPSA